MATQPIPADFLADLDLVCPPVEHCNLPVAFLRHLEIAEAHALAFQQPEIDLDELTSLAADLDALRRKKQLELQGLLKQIPEDDPLRQEVSLFGTMDYGRLETAHTRVLAWLLANREHGFGWQLLQALLCHLVGTQVQVIEANVESEWPAYGGRIDVLAKGQWEESANKTKWLLAIEAKIDAEEGEGQLSLYDDWLEGQRKRESLDKVFRVFLTAKHKAASRSNWEALSFSQLAGILRHELPTLKACKGYDFLRYYLTGLLKDVCRLKLSIRADSDDPHSALEYLQPWTQQRGARDG